MRSLGRGARWVVLVLAILLASCSANGSSTTNHSVSSSSTAPSAATTSPAVANSGSWTTYGGGFSRTSADTTDPSFSAAPGEVWKSGALDGSVYGEPLVYRGAVYVATENDTVYAFSAATGSREWSPEHLATPAPASALPCGDLSPTVGITSTMVIDPSSGVLFASAETSGGSGVRHFLYAIDSSTGRVLWNRDVDQSWDAAAQLQRISLAISNHDVLVGFGGNYGDCGNYNGWVLGVPESGSGPILHYRVPTAREGAVWAPGGVTVDSSGNVFVATGNGSATAGQPFDHGDAVIGLSPTLGENGYFAPSDWAQLNETDSDLGSTAPVLLGNDRIFEIGKGGTAYLLNSASLGGIGGQLASLGVCFSIGASAYLAPNVYVVCTNDGRIAQVRVGPGDSLHGGWSWPSPGGAVSSPTIAGGLLWSVDRDASTLYGVNLSDGTTRFSTRLQVGSLASYVAVSAAGGMLFVAGTGGVEALR